MKALIYAAKSTEDKHGSIPTQIEDCRGLAQAEGLEVVEPPHEDESRSAYKGNRGPGLARAMATCERLGATLIVQHSDRLARGSGRKGEARHLVQYALWASENDLTIRSVQDDQTFGDLLYAVVTGQRNFEDSDRKSKSVRDGLTRRKARGAPVGPVPFGYVPEPALGPDGQPVLNDEGKPVTTGRRVVHPVNAGIVVSMFERAAAGATPGEIARSLNADGVRTTRGGAWTARSVRDLIRLDSYEACHGYPLIIDSELADRARARLTRMDPAAVQRRKGGRPTSPAFVLRATLFCVCGRPMYCDQRPEGQRTYVCAEVRHCTGICTRPRIPATLIEGHVLSHLDEFVGQNLVTWIAERLALRSDEQLALGRTLDERRSELAALDASASSA